MFTAARSSLGVPLQSDWVTCMTREKEYRCDVDPHRGYVAQNLHGGGRCVVSGAVGGVRFGTTTVGNTGDFGWGGGLNSKISVGLENHKPII